MITSSAIARSPGLVHYRERLELRGAGTSQHCARFAPAVGRFCGSEGLFCGVVGGALECPPSFGPTDMRHMLQGAREGASDAGQSVSRRADRPPAAGAGAERADGRELYPAQWHLPPHLLSVAQEVRRPHGDRGHPAQAPGARECPLEGAARRSGTRARGPEGDQRKKMERVAVRRAQVRYATTRRLSCRRACTLLRVARSALGYAARRPGRDATLVHRLWRCAGLALPRRRGRRKVRTGARVRPLADRPNAVWTYDLIHDACTDGMPFKCLTVVDEF